MTNRGRVRGQWMRTIADSLEFGYMVTQFTGERTARGTPRLIGRGHPEFVDSARVTQAVFLTRLQAADRDAAQRGEGAVLYVHGYATSFAGALRQGAELAHRGSYGGPFIVFAWPAHESVVTWPTRQQWMSQAYREDSVTAAQSAVAFRDVLQLVRSAVRPGALTVLGHSMGAQLVSGALVAPSPARTALARRPLRALVFFAPDVAAGWFQAVVAPAIRPLAMRRVVYASQTDRMLWISRWVNHGRRVGQLEDAEPGHLPGVELIDVTRAPRVGAAWASVLDLNHAMLASAGAVLDFFDVVVPGRSSACRTASGRAARAQAGVWNLLDTPGSAGDCGTSRRAAAGRAATN